MIYIEIRHHEPEYVTAYVEAIEQEPRGEIFSARIEQNNALTAEDYCRVGQAILARLPFLLKTAYDAGEQNARNGKVPGSGFHLGQIDDKGQGITF